MPSGPGQPIRPTEPINRRLQKQRVLTILLGVCWFLMAACATFIFDDLTTALVASIGLLSAVGVIVIGAALISTFQELNPR